MSVPLLEVNDLKKHYIKRAPMYGPAAVVYAVDGVSFAIAPGETLALVGESGCGKSTVGRSVLRLHDITAGQVVLNGQRIDNLSARAMRPLRRHVQVVFQDSNTSLNPRMRVGDLIAEPMRNFAVAGSEVQIERRVAVLLDHVRLARSLAQRRPHQLSGGQRQRVCIARALAADPDLIVCDEAVSALDGFTRAQIIDLLKEIQRTLGLALLFISHDLAVVATIAHRIAVMYLGKIVEIGDQQQIFRSPKHPYTAALLSAVPVPDPDAARERIILKGDLPSVSHPPSGCRFHTRCPHAFDRCRIEEPLLLPIDADRSVACHLSGLSNA